MSKTRDTPIFYLTEDVKKQFKDTRDMLDQILETFEILEDKELMNRIQIADREFEEGKTTTLDDLLKEIK